MTGHTVKLSTDEKYQECGDTNCIFVDYKNITKILKKGDFVFIDDGLIKLKVTEIGPTYLNTGE